MSTTTTPTDAPAAGTSARRPDRRPGGGDLVRRFALPVAWIGLIVVFTVLRPDTFATSANWASMLSTQAVFLILTLGLLIPLTTGDIDLSLAYTLTFSSVLVAVLNVEQGWPIVPAIKPVSSRNSAAAKASGAVLGRSSHMPIGSSHSRRRTG